MNRYIDKAKNYIIKKNEVFIGIGVIIFFILIVTAFVFYIRSKGPNIVYEPAKACDLLTPTEAQDLLGDKILSTEKSEPVITDNLATSKCSYTDQNPDADGMKVAAVAIQSGINDKGIEQNKLSFALKRPKSGTETIKGLGENAYFNQANGQLNILDGHKWIILSYGVGNSPESNTVDEAVKVAHKILN